MGTAVRLPFIEKMPDRPSEIPIDWEPIANRFYSHVMDPTNQIRFNDRKGKIKFGAFFEDGGHELITFGGIVLGAILRNEDVSKLLSSLEDYYSDSFGIFLNNPDNKQEEYWYLMYVNCLAAEIIRKRCMDVEGYPLRLRNSLDTLRRIAHQVNYHFDDQGYNFSDQKPFTKKDDFRQPDTIGAYSYLMLLGYETFGEEGYLEESKRALTAYQSFDQNPWYEIPSGAMASLAAMKLNELGYSYNLNKIVNFALDARTGSLHVGTWGDKEVNGLMLGWRGHSREEALRTAYSLETFIPIPFLAPIAKWDVRYAALIGKYVLNMSANSKLFFSDFISLEAQSRPDLSPDLPYETLHRNKEGHTPYAFGDFHSHKSVYGGAITLWLDSIIKKTNDDFILQVNLSKTDFLSDSEDQTYLYYNPWENDREVIVDVGNEKSEIFDHVTKELIEKDAINEVRLQLQPRSALVITIRRD